MTIKLTNDRSAAVNTELPWLDIKTNPPPLGTKLQLINRKLGVAVYGNYTRGVGWTHWQALPKFIDTATK